MKTTNHLNFQYDGAAGNFMVRVAEFSELADAAPNRIVVTIFDGADVRRVTRSTVEGAVVAGNAAMDEFLDRIRANLNPPRPAD